MRELLIATKICPDDRDGTFISEMRSVRGAMYSKNRLEGVLLLLGMNRSSESWSFKSVDWRVWHTRGIVASISTLSTWNEWPLVLNSLHHDSISKRSRSSRTIPPVTKWYILSHICGRCCLSINQLEGCTSITFIPCALKLLIRSSWWIEWPNCWRNLWYVSKTIWLGAVFDVLVRPVNVIGKYNRTSSEALFV